eukprot:m.228332 g.228332  ORF g.228332 m.228332 type:complete len:592 (-) comp11729_c0_seq1:34-1809(-)
MVSSMLHMWRGNADTLACVAAFGATTFLLRLYCKRLSHLLWVFVSIQPIIWIPDSTQWADAQIRQLLPSVSPTHVFGAITAAFGISFLLSFLNKPKEPKFVVDEDFLANTANFQAVYAGATQSNIGAVVSELRAGFLHGVSKPLAKRREQLLGLRRFLVENEAALVQALKDDLGRPEYEGLYYDVLMPVSEIDHTLKGIASWAAPKPVGGSVLTFPSTQWLQEEPVGVVLVISCWNFPINLALLPVIGAVAAGNVVVLKPSLTSPATGRLLRDVLPKYLDPRVITVAGPFSCSDIECSQTLLQHRFDHIFFTGSSRGGRAVMELAAKHVTPCTMELGGKNPVFVTADADLSLAAKRTIWGRMLNAGQQCIAPDYVLVDEKVADKFCELTKYWVEKMYGKDPKTSGNIGRINASQTNRIIGLLSGHGGKVIVGGGHDKAANHVDPTVILVDSPSSPLLKEETFGPILTVLPVKSLDAAIDYVNAGEKPLALYIFSSSAADQNRIITSTSSGGVTVNATLFHAGHPDFPFGGVGNSGFGVYHGKHTFDCFSHKKPVLVKATWPDGGLLTDPFFLYPPWTSTKISVLRVLAKFM